MPVLPDGPPLTSFWPELTGGSGAPDDANGNNGDVYVDFATGQLYSKTAGTWSAVSGAGGAVQVFENRDPAPPDDPTKAAVSFPTNGGTLSQWSVALQAWV